MPISYLSSNRNVGEVNMYKINFQTMILLDKVNYLWIGFKKEKKNPPRVLEELFWTIQLNGSANVKSSMGSIFHRNSFYPKERIPQLVPTQIPC